MDLTSRENAFYPSAPSKFTFPNQKGCIRWTPREILAQSAKGPQGSATNFSLPALATTELLSLSFTAQLGNLPPPHPSYARGRILFSCAPAKGCPSKRSGSENDDNIQSRPSPRNLFTPFLTLRRAIVTKNPGSYLIDSFLNKQHVTDEFIFAAFHLPQYFNLSVICSKALYEDPGSTINPFSLA